MKRAFILSGLLSVVGCGGGALPPPERGEASHDRGAADADAPAADARGAPPAAATPELLSPPGGPVAELRFHWPDSFSMQVHVIHQRRKGQEAARSALTYTVGAHGVEKGHEIYQPYTPYFFLPGAHPNSLHGLRTKLAGLLPKLHVDGHGNFLEIDGLGRHDRDERVHALGLDDPGHMRIARAALSDRAITAAAKRYWDHRVGMWYGHADLERGKTYSATHEMHIPELEGATVGATTEYSFVDWAKCKPSASDAVCVEIHLETKPVREEMLRAVEAFKKAGGRDHDGSVIRDVEKREGVKMILEPHTLRPHRYEEDHYTLVGVREKGGHEAQTITFDTHVEEYTHDP